MAMDKNITGQANKVMVWLMKYYPVRIKNVGEQQKADRQTIWDFKDGRAYEQVALMTARHLQELFGSRLTSIVFTCVPASTQEMNELRYKRFSEGGGVRTYPCHQRLSSYASVGSTVGSP